MIGTASFDIFDTLLTRTFARPGDLFMEVGSRLAAAGEIAVSAEEFALTRGRAETSAREGTVANEVSLREIYVAVASRLGWNEKLLERAEEVELAVEAGLGQSLAEHFASGTLAASPVSSSASPSTSAST